MNHTTAVASRVDTKPLPAGVPSVYLEPVLALLTLGGTLAARIIQLQTPPIVWVLEISLCVIAGFAARFPRAAAGASMVVMLALMIWGRNHVGMGMFACSVHIFALVRLRVPGYRWISLSLWIVATVLFCTLPVHVEDLIASFMMMVLLGGLAVGGALVWRRLSATAAHEREFAIQRMEATRMALARDLHDTVAQTLAHTAMRAYLAAEDPGVPSQVRAELDAIAAECQASSDDLRQLLSALRDKATSDPSEISLDADGLTLAVQTQAERLQAAGFSSEAKVTVTGLSPLQATTLHKISVEAVTNIIKHAAPNSACSISITSDGEAITALFANHARAGRPGPPGMGLVGIRERAGLLAGSATTEAKDGLWTLTVRLPRAYDTAAHPAELADYS